MFSSVDDDGWAIAFPVDEGDGDLVFSCWSLHYFEIAMHLGALGCLNVLYFENVRQI